MFPEGDENVKVIQVPFSLMSIFFWKMFLFELILLFSLSTILFSAILRSEMEP